MSTSQLAARVRAGSPARDAAGWRDAVRDGLGIWLLSRFALTLVVVLASWLLRFYRTYPARYPGLGPFDRFVQWDSFHYLRIVRTGYFGEGRSCCEQAFFPGYPLSVRALVPLVAGNDQLAGLLVTWVAAAVAAVLLWRVAYDATGSRWSARAAVGFLAVAPYGVFLSAMYSEALFLALALGAWWAGTRQHWWLAGVLAGLACLVRVNGLFLAVMLALAYLGARRTRGRLLRLDALALLLPWAAVLGYFTWLHARTGSWSSWSHAEDLGWHRTTEPPWRALPLAWKAAVHAPAPDVTVAYWAELVTAAFGLALTVALLVRRRWPEAAYIGLNLLAATSSVPMASSPRYALLWFPGYVLAAQVALRWRWLVPVAAALCVPFLVALSLAFAAHLWVA
ncbi:mannosyltransferase PIG-V [Motilibacter rhizosphaerae]|uniref:Mannosyltransferase PIG-V n=1 Tax=Motilibacter rhizosphaerae TaxID=598652 RepID=A0A4Q7NQS0_9ACTN|nr:mannosyltransferase family protein [Motilibacter rhizosphaerae]RZS86940.1 mannosyltransferase PIG-V [Motilibacter rhizosphaerae]